MRVEVVESTCDYCGAVMDNPSGRRRYCSPTHATEARKVRIKAEHKEQMELLASAPSLLAAYDASMAAAREAGTVIATDGAAVATGRELAKHLEKCGAEMSGAELSSALYLVPHLMNVLRELLATPQSRLSAKNAAAKIAAQAQATAGGGAKTDDSPGPGSLAEFRERRSRRA